MVDFLQRRTINAKPCAHDGDVFYPSKSFYLPLYAGGLAQVFVEAPSPLLLCNRPCNSGVLAFLGVEAKHGEDSDVSSSPSP